MIQKTFIRELEEIVGTTHVCVTNTGVELYSYDASQAQGHPGVVVFPADTHQISLIVKAANKAGVDFIPRGFGTNLSGGTISLTKGLVICMSRFNQILGIYPESRYAVVQPGVTNLEVQQALAKVGSFYAPDPASQKVATLGGNAGENSGGPLCLKYGVTSNHILGMEVVLADGRIMRVGGPALDPPGFDLRGLLIGSEGSFAIITELTLRTLPKTQSVITMLAVYDSIQDAARSVSRIISAGIVPNTLEMMDATVIGAVEANAPCGYPTDAAAVLIIEVEGMTVGLKEQAQKIEQICMDTQCRTIRTAGNEAERDRLWQGRRGAFGAMARLAPNYLVNDACVPRTKLPEALRQVKAIADRYGCPVGNVFHAGDGNLHPLLLFDSRDPVQVEQVHKAGWDIMHACAELGGTISGEHGIGHEKQDAMRMVFSGDDLNTQQAVKRALDPENVLNPNKIIPFTEIPGQPLAPGEPTVLKRLGGVSAKGVAKVMTQIKAARESGQTIFATGARVSKPSHSFGGAVHKPVYTSGMDQVIEYDPANQFITVGSGMTMKTLQDILGEKNQFLPVRPPFFDPDSTVGALAATGTSGPERMIYGAPRDLALGLGYIDSQCRMIFTGGKVVKNVAGYDMTRLLIGSFGALGVITQVTWRVVTRPERCCAATATGSLGQCLDAALKLMNHTLSPVFITIAPQKNVVGSFRILTGFEGLEMVVDHQARLCRDLFEVHQLRTGKPLDYDLVDGPVSRELGTVGQAPFVVKAGMAVEKLKENQQKICPETLSTEWLIDFGCGRIFAGFKDLSSDQWTTLSQAMVGDGGVIQIEKAPESFGRENNIFGGIQKPEWQLSRAIKQALDPDALFASHRLPGQVVRED